MLYSRLSSHGDTRNVYLSPIAYFHHQNLVQLNLWSICQIYFKTGQQAQKLLVEYVRHDKMTA